MAAGLRRGILVAVMRRWHRVRGGAGAQERCAVVALHGGEVAVLDLRPDGPGSLAVAAERAVVVVVGVVADVVAAFLDGRAVQEPVDLATVRLLVCPRLDGAEHCAVDLDGLVAERGVVEDAEDVIHHFLDWDAWVLPCVEDSSMEGQDVCPDRSIETYGVTYCSILDATRPPTGFKIFEK